MATVKKKKITTVHAHPRHVPISAKNLAGITIVDQHSRHFLGVAVTVDELKKIAEEYRSKRPLRPSPDDLDYFNGKFPAAAPFSPLDPDVVKALLGSESGFVRKT